MINFVTIIPELAKDVERMVDKIGFKINSYKIAQEPPQKDRYNLRISRNSEEFIKAIGLDKR